LRHLPRHGLIARVDDDSELSITCECDWKPTHLEGLYGKSIEFDEHIDAMLDEQLQSKQPESKYPHVRITTAGQGSYDRITSIEIDGVPLRGGQAIKVEDALNDVTRVTVTFIAGHVERVQA
jgi:hypothetical protein